MREYLSDIEGAARSAADLCTQMMAYAGKGRLDVRPLNLTGLVREMAQLLRVSISKDIVVRFELDDAVPMIAAESSQIRQIIMNLITNAADAIGDEGGEIHLVTGSGHFDEAALDASYFETDLAHGPYVFLEVSDTGGGMSPEVLEKLFDPFFSTKPTGRGLGLAAVQGIIRSHKGAVRLVSRPGVGTSFRVLLPAAAENVVDSAPEAQPEETTWDAGKLLVVDDTEAVHTVTSRMLKRTGFEILRADDGASAIAMFEAYKDEIAVVLLDVVMPGMTGEQVLGELLQINPAVPVVLSSGYADQAGESVVSSKGAAAFLPKPYARGDLLQLLESLLKEPRPTPPA